MSREITRHSRHPAKPVMVGASLSGNHAAQVGSVAAALRHLAKQVMIGLPPDLRRAGGHGQGARPPNGR